MSSLRMIFISFAVAVTSMDLNPRYDTVSSLPEVTPSMTNFPSMLVMTAFLPDFSTIVAPMSGPPSSSVTVPFTVIFCWAKPAEDTRMKRSSNKVLIFISLIMD